MKRRAFVSGAAGLTGWFVTGPTTSWAFSADDKRLQNRLELWANYARRTKNLLARVTTTRETSLLDEPLVVTGNLIFAAPDTLVLRDDGLKGSTTLIEGDRVRIVPHGAEALPGPELHPTREPAVAWLADRLLRVFAPADPQTLIEDIRHRVPKGRGYRLELMPARGSAVRQWIRSVTLHLDPVAGAVTQLLIAEAAGDRMKLQLTDHRQNVPDEDLQAALERATEGL